MLEVILLIVTALALGALFGYASGYRRGFAAARKVIDLDPPREGSIEYPYTRD